MMKISVYFRQTKAMRVDFMSESSITIDSHSRVSSFTNQFQTAPIYVSTSAGGYCASGREQYKLHWFSHISVSSDIPNHIIYYNLD